ncbi:MAG: alkaline phosphatase PhoX, partial [Longimicrobiales bacterium]
MTITLDHWNPGFLPNQPYVNGEGGDLTAAGQLQMLAIRNQPNYDTDTGQVVGRTLPVDWVDIHDPDPRDADNPAAVFEQGWEGGGARFSRLEGCWYDEGSICVVATSGGDASQGQVWQYRPAGPDTGELTLVFESPSRSVLSKPDTVCVSPRGGIILCEDGDNDPQYVRGLTPD